MFCFAQNRPGASPVDSTVIPTDTSQVNTELMRPGASELATDAEFATDIKKKKKTREKERDPNRTPLFTPRGDGPIVQSISMKRSLVFPGLGQLYNRDYWRAPAFAGAFSILSYRAIHNYIDFKDQRDEYRSALNTLDLDIPSNLETLNSLREGRDRKKRRNTQAIAGAVLVYGYNVADAALRAKIKTEDIDHSPTKAAYFAAFAPGMGQIYNKKYWKLPIVYGALGGCGAVIGLNTNRHKKWRSAYLNSLSIGTYEVDNREFTTEQLRELRNYYRRNIDVSYIVFGALYLLQVADATVDAHFYDFDIDDNLSLELNPYIEQDKTQAGSNFNNRIKCKN